MRLLCLDLGTKTGWALLDNGAVTSGTWVLATEAELRAQKGAKLDRCCDMRPARLQQRLDEVGPVDWVYFEDVQFASTQLQAQLWGGLRAMVSLLYPASKIKAVPVGTLKKFATGHGNATKEQMAGAFLVQPNGPFTLWPAARGRMDLVTAKGIRRKVDDNEVDAYHLLNLARKDLNL